MKVVMMSHFTTHQYDGPQRGADYPYNIYVYPNEEEGESIVDRACDSAADFCE